jgi:hypothetical protein
VEERKEEEVTKIKMNKCNSRSEFKGNSHHLRKSRNWTVKVKVKVKVTLRLAVYRQSVRLGVKPLETHDQTFFLLSSCGNSPYVTSSLTRRWVCLLWICLAFRQVYISHIYSMLLNISSFYTTHKSSVSTGFTERIMTILRILCYNGSLVFIGPS